MKYKNTLNQIKTLLAMDVKLAQMKLADGVTVVEAEEFEAEYSIGIVTEDGVVPMPVGEYETEDGKIVVVAQEGIIAEVKEKDAEEEAPEEAAPVMEEQPVEAEAKPKRVVESVSKETFFEEIEKLKAELSAIKEEKEALKVELAAQEQEAGAVAISHNPEANKTEGYKFGANRSANTLDRVYTKLFN
jgi:hypothetical protein